MDAAILDSDILSEFLKRRNAAVQQRAAAYIQQYGGFEFSAVTRFEIVRGYKEQNATTQLARFAIFFRNSLIHPVTDAIWDRAADLWVHARKNGRPHADADILIAATALDSGRILATGNIAHFAWITGLALNDWRQP